MLNKQKMPASIFTNAGFKYKLFIICSINPKACSILALVLDYFFDHLSEVCF